jgi:LPXTG-site transpeptidase (sortase) family protein
MKQVVVYDSRSSRKRKFKYNLMHKFGAVLMSFSLSGLIYGNFFYVEGQIPEVITESLPQVAISEPVQEVQTDTKEFKVYIPKINITSDVVLDVDPFDEAVYGEALKKGVAHAKGSSLPGQGKGIYLFAHSTVNNPLLVADYNAVFYRVGELDVNDSIYVNYNGKTYEYKVDKKVVVKPSDLSWLDVQNSEVLILQTCWPPGTSWRRMIVTARAV